MSDTFKKDAAQTAKAVWKNKTDFKKCLEDYKALNERCSSSDKSGVFLWWVLKLSRNDLAEVIQKKAGYCPSLLEEFRREGRLSECAHVGDAVFLDIYRCGLGEHCGVVVGVGKNYVETIEGDISAKFGMLGGEIGRKVRPNSLCLAFVRTI